MLSAPIAPREVAVLHVCPQQGRAPFGSDGDVELRESCLPTLLGGAQVHEEGVEAHAGEAPRRCVLVVMGLVELSLIVPDHLCVCVTCT